MIHIRVSGDGFLRHMIRIIVGALLEVGRKKIKPEAVQALLKAKARKAVVPTAKARGLALVKVYY